MWKRGYRKTGVNPYLRKSDLLFQKLSAQFAEQLRSGAVCLDFFVISLVKLKFLEIFSAQLNRFIPSDP